MRHRESGKKVDSFTCYQRLEDDIAYIQKNGVDEFEKAQKIKERVINGMLREFNDGRSKSYYCIAATVLETGELEEALTQARQNSDGLDIQEKSSVLLLVLDEIARQKNYSLRLRK
jgi:hypothetical protein